MESAGWAALSPEGVDKVMLREQGSVNCLKELIPSDRFGKPSDYSVDGLGPEGDMPIDGGCKCREAQEGTPRDQILDVQGRLKSNIAFWRETLRAPVYVLDWIESEYKLPLHHLPDTFSMGNHNSALTHLKYLNQFLHKVKFKYEDIRVALLMFTRQDFLFKFDLKSGYHHLDIFEPHQKYLGFAWREGKELSYFVFKVLPFGLATVCYAFTKLMRPLVGFWRGRGLRVVLYLDNGIVAAKREEAIWESEQFKETYAVPVWLLLPPIPSGYLLVS